MGIRLLAAIAAVAVAGLIGCGGGDVKDPYKPRLVGEDPSGPGLSPKGAANDDDDDDDDDDGTSLGSDKSDAKTDPWFKMRKCTKVCVQQWNVRSKQGAHSAIERDCEHRCKRRWFTCTAAINNAMVVMAKDKLRKDVLAREGSKNVRNKGLRECQRRRWLLDTIGCMIKAENMAAFDDCEDEDRKRKRALRRKRGRLGR